MHRPRWGRHLCPLRGVLRRSCGSNDWLILHQNWFIIITQLLPVLQVDVFLCLFLKFHSELVSTMVDGSSEGEIFSPPTSPRFNSTTSFQSAAGSLGEIVNERCSTADDIRTSVGRWRQQRNTSRHGDETVCHFYRWWGCSQIRLITNDCIKRNWFL